MLTRKLFITLISTLIFSSILYAQDTAYNAGTFDGAGDYISVSSNSNLNISDSLTIEAWINANGLSNGNQGIVGKFSWGTGNDRQYMLRLVNGTIYFNVSINGLSGAGNEISINDAGGYITAGQWHHVAGTVVDSMIYLYVDGTQVSSTNTHNDGIYTSTNANFTIGAVDNGVSLFFNGLIDEVRLSNTVRYTTNFTVSDKEFIADQNTAALYHFNQAVGYTSVVDASLDTADFQNGSLSGNAAFTSDGASLSRAQGNLFYSNGSGDVTAADSANLDITGALTVEAWVSLDNNTGTQAIVAKWGSDLSYYLSVQNGNPVFAVSSDGSASTTVTGNYAVSTGFWHHIAGVYDGSSAIKIYIDGYLAGSTSFSSTINAGAEDLTIASNAGSNYLNGYVDEVRISSAARYSGNTYTIPSAAFLTDSNSELYYDFNNDGTTSQVIDISSNDNDGSVSGGSFASSPLYQFTVAAATNNPGSSSESASGSNIPMLAFTLDGSNLTSGVSINQISLKKYGTIDGNTDITTNGISAYEDINQNGILDASDQLINSGGPFASGDSVLKIDMVGKSISSGSSMDILITADLNGSASAAETFQLALVGAGVASEDASGNPFSIHSPSEISGGLKTVSTSPQLTLSEGIDNPSAQYATASQSNVVVLQLNMAASSAANVTITAMDVTAHGGGNHITDISTIYLINDLNNDGVYSSGVDQTIASGSPFVSGTDTTITFSGLSETISSGNSENWLVMYDFSSASGVFGAKVYAADVTLSSGSVSGDVTGNFVTINSTGALEIQLGESNPSSGYVYDGQSKVAMLQLKFIPNATENQVFSSIAFTGSGSGSEDVDVSGVYLYRDLNQNGQVDLDQDENVTSAQVYTSDNGIIRFDSFSDTLFASTPVYYLVSYNFSGSASASETFRLSLVRNDSVHVTGLSTSQPIYVSGAQLDGNYQTVTDAGNITVSLGSNTPISRNETVNATDMEMLQFTLAVGPAEDAQINDISFKDIGSADEVNDIDSAGIKLYRDDNNNGLYDVGTDTYIESAISYGGFELAFDGTGDYVNVADNGSSPLDINGQAFTMEAWIYSTGGNTGHNIIVNKETVWEMALTNGTLSAAITTSSGGWAWVEFTTSTISDNVWTHVAVTYDGSAVRGFVNGTLQAQTQSRSGNITTNNNDFRVAARGGDGTASALFNGYIDEVRISDAVRYSSSFTQPSAPFTVDNNTALLFHFDEASGSTVYNAADITNTGTMYGDAAFQQSSSGISNGKVTIQTNNITLAAGSSQDWLLLYNLSGSASVGETFQARIVQNSDINAKGVTSGLSLDVTGAPVNGNAVTMSANGSLSMTEGNSNPAPTTIGSSQNQIVMLQMQFTAGQAEADTIKSVTFSSSGSADESTDITTVDLYQDANSNGLYDAGVDSVISTGNTYAADNGTITFSSLNEVIPAGSSENWLVLYNLNGTASGNETFQINIPLNTSITVTAASGSLTASGAPVDGSTMTVKTVGKITLSEGTNNPTAQNIADDVVDQVMSQFNIAASAAEDVEIDLITLTDDGSGDISSGLNSNGLKVYEDVNNNGVLDAGTDNLLGTAASIEKGDPGNAVNMDGSNEGITIPDAASLDITGDLTLEAWIYIRNYPAAYGGILAKYSWTSPVDQRSYQITLLSGGTISFRFSSDGTAGTEEILNGTYTLNKSQWYHIAATFNSSTSEQIIYVDGVNKDSRTAGASAIFSGTSPLYIGTINGAGSQYFDGLIEEARVSSTLRYTSNFAVPVVPFAADANTAGLYHFNDGLSATTAADSSSNGNDGSLLSGTSYTVSDAPIAGGATITFGAPKPAISQGSSEDWIITYDLNGTIPQDSTLRNRIWKPNNIQGTGVTSAQTVSSYGVPVYGPYMTIKNIGTLTAELGENNPGPGNIAADGSNVVMMQLKMTASDVENITVSALQFNAQGSGDDVNDITSGSIQLYNDINSNGVYDSGVDQYIGQATSFSADNGNVTISTSGHVINAGETQYWLLLYSFNGSGSVGETYFSRIVQNTAFSASGATSGESITPSATLFPITGNIKTISAVGNMSLALGASTPANSNITAGDTAAVMMQLQLTASSAETLKVVSLQFKASGTANENTDLDSLSLYRDLNNNGIFDSGVDTFMVSSTYSADNGTATFTFADSLLFPSGETQNWLLLYSLNGTASSGEDFQASIPLTSYLKGKGASSGLDFSVTGSMPITGAQKTISAVGTITITDGVNAPGTGTVGIGAQDVVMMQLNVEASATENVAVDSVVFTALGDMNDATGINAVSLYWDKNNNGTLDLTVDQQIDTLRTYSSDNGSVTFRNLADTISAGQSQDWLLVYDLSSSGSSGQTFRSKFNLNSDFYGKGLTSTQNINVSGAPVTGAQKTLTLVGELTLEAGTANPANGNIAANESNLAMVQFKLTGGSAENVEVNSITFNHGGSADPKTDISLNGIKLYNDANNNGTYDSGTDVFIGQSSKFGGNAIDVDGSSGYVHVNDGGTSSLDVSGSEFTMEAWIYPQGTGNHLIIVNKESVWEMALNNSNLSAAIYTSSGGWQWVEFTTTTINTNEWTHVAVTYDGSAVRGFVGGILQAQTQTRSGNIQTNNNDFRIGARGGDAAASAFFNGLIDETRISDVVRYTADFSPASSSFSADNNTVALFHFDEPQGSTTAKNSAIVSNADDGSINGNTTLVESTAISVSTVAVNTSGQTIDAGASENWLLIYDLADSASDGETFISSVLQNQLVAVGQTSGQTLNIQGSNVTGGTKTVTTTGSITLAKGGSNPEASNESPSQQNVPMLQIQLTPSAAETLLVSQLKVKSSGTLDDLNDVDSVRVYDDSNNNGVYDSGVDSQLGFAQAFSADNGIVTFNFSDSITIPAATTKNWLITYDLAGSGSNGDNFSASLELDNYITITGKTSRQTIISGGTYPIVSNAKTISNIGVLSLVLGSNTPAATNSSSSASSIPILQFNLAASDAEDIRIDSLEISASGTIDDAVDISSIVLYRDVNSNGLLDLTQDVQIGSGSFSVNDGTLRFTGLNDTLAAGSNSDYLIVYNLAGSATNGETFAAGVAQNSHVFTSGLSGAAHSATVLGAPVTGNTMTISNVGTLTITTGPNNPGNTAEPNDAQNLAMLQINLSASSVEDITVNSITFTAAGTFDDAADISADGIKLYRDINSNGIYESGSDQYIGQANAYTTDDGTAQISTGGQTITAGSSENWLLLYNLAGSANNGETFLTRLIQGSDVNAVGVTSGSAITPGKKGQSQSLLNIVIGDGSVAKAGYPVTGGTKTISSTGSLTLTRGSNDPGAKNIAKAGTNVEILQLQLTASSAETLLVSSLQIKANGSGDDNTDISAVKLYRDMNDNGSYDDLVDTLLASSSYSTDDGVLTFTFADSVEIAAGSGQNWLLTYDMAGTATNGETFGAGIELSTYIVSTGKFTHSSSSINISLPLSSGLQTIDNVGVLTVSAGSNNPTASNEANDVQRVAMLQFVLTASQAESLRVDSLAFTGLGTIDDANDLESVVLYEDKNDNGVIDLTIDRQLDTLSTYSVDGGKVWFTAVAETLVSGASQTWLLAYNLNGLASADETFQAQFGSGDLYVSGLEGTAHSATVTGLPRTSSTKTVASTGILTLTAGPSNPSSKNISANEQNLPMVQFNMAASSTEDINVNSVVFKHGGTANSETDISINGIKLYRDVNDNGLYDSGTDVYIGQANKYGGNALTVDGTNAYVNVQDVGSSSLDISGTAMTLEAWIYPTATGASRIIMNKEGVYEIALNNNNLQAAIATASGGWAWVTFTTTSINLNEWTHVAVTYDGSAVRGFVNGTLQAQTQTRSGNVQVTNNDFRIGARGADGAASAFFTGKIDELRVSDAVRYTTNFTPSTSGFTADGNTMGLFHFDDAVGSTTTTNSATVSNVENGTLQGNAALEQVSGGVSSNSIAISTTGQVISAGTNENWLLTYDLADSAAVGETFITSVKKAQVSAVGATSSTNISLAGSDVSGGEMTVSVTGAVQLALGSSNPSPGNIANNEQQLSMIQLQLNVSAVESVALSSIQFKAEGTGDDANDLTNSQLFLDANDNGVYDSGIDTQLGSNNSYSLDNGLMQFTFSPAETLAAGSSTSMILLYNYAGSAVNGNTFKARIELSSYLSLTGVTSGEAISPSSTYPLVGSEMTVSNIGQLSISAGSNMPAATSFSPSSGNIAVLQYNLSANGIEDIRIDSLEVSASGTIDDALDISSVVLYRDVNSNGLLDLTQDVQIGSGTFSVNDGTLRFTGLNDTLSAGSNSDYLVVYNLAGTSSNSETFATGVAQNSHVYTTGLSGTAHAATVLGAPVNSNTMTISNVGTLTITTGPNNPGNTSEPNDAQNLAMLQLHLSASDAEDIKINTITFTATGTADDVTDLSSNGIRLYYDINSNGVFDSGTDVYIGQASAFSANDGTAQITTGGRTIGAGNSEDWLLLYDLAGSADNGETFISRLIQGSDVNAEGVTSGSGITPGKKSNSTDQITIIVGDGSISKAGYPVTGGTKTISSTGSLTLARGSNDPGAKNIANAATNIEVFQLQLTASAAETLLVSSLQLKANGSGDDNTDITSAKLYRDMNDNGIFDDQVDTLLASSSYASNDGVLTFTFTDSVEIAAGTSQNWLLTYDMAGTATNGETFGAGIELSNYIVSTGKFTRNASSINVSIPLRSGLQTIDAVGVLTVSQGANNPAASNEADDAQRVSMLQMVLTASQAESLRVDSLAFTGLGTIDDAADLESVVLYEDKNGNGIIDLTIDRQLDTLSTFTVDGGKVWFTAVAETLASGTNQTWLLAYNLNGLASANETFQAQFANGDLYVSGLEGTAHSANVSGLPRTSAIKTVASTGVLTLSAGPSNPSSKNISANEQSLAMVQFNLAASSTENINVNSVVFSHSGTANAETDISSNGITLYRDVNDNGVFDSGTDVFIGQANKYGGNTLTVDGTNSYVNVQDVGSSSLDISGTAMTLEAWIYPTATGASRIIMNKESVYEIALNNSNLQAAIATASGGWAWVTFTTTAINLNEWTHVAVTYDGSAVRGFVNGTLQAQTQTRSGNVQVTNNDFRIGARGADGAATALFTGKIDELRVSDAVRYTTSFTPSSASFVPDGNTMALFHFDDAVGSTTATNSATVANVENGTLQGNAALEQASGGVSSNSISINTTGQSIDASTSQNWLLVYDLADSASIGETFIGTVKKAQISATGATSSVDISASGADISGGEMKVNVVGSMTFTAGSNSPSPGYFATGDSYVPMLQLQLNPSAIETLAVSQLKVKGSGTGDESTDIDRVILYRDNDNNGLVSNVIDDSLTSGTFSADNGVITFTLADTLVAGTSVNWLLASTYNAGATSNETFALNVELNSYLTVKGVTSGEAITPSGAPISGSSQTVRNVGAITMQLGSKNPTAGFYPSDATNAELIQVELSTSSAETLAVSSIAFSASGTLHDVNDITAASLYKDVNNNGVFDQALDTQLGSNQTYSGDNGKITFNFAPAETLLASTTENWLVVYTLNGNGSNASTFSTSLAQNSDLSVTGVESGQSISVTGAPINGNQMTIQNIGALTLTLGANNPGNSNETNAATNVEMLQLYIAASPIENVQIDSIVFTAGGTGNDATGIASGGVRVYRDANADGIYQSASDVLLGSAGSFSGDDGTFVLRTAGEVITKSTSEYWLVVYNFAGTAANGETFIARLLQSTDVYAVGVTSASAANISLDGSAINKAGKMPKVSPNKTEALGKASNPANGGTKTISNTGSLALSLGGNNPDPSSVAYNQTGLVVEQLRLTAGNAENINISAIKFIASGTLNDAGALSNVQLFLDVNDNGIYDSGTDTQIGSNANYDGDNGIVIFSSLSESITAGATENWLLIYNLNGTASNGQTMKASITLTSHVTATGATSGQSISPSGIPVESNQHTVSSNGQLTASAGDAMPGATNEDQNGTANMYQLKVAANSVENITITQMVFTHDGTGSVGNISAVKLYSDTNNDGVGDSQLGTDQVYSGSTVTFGSLSQTINADTSATYVVQYVFSGASNNSTFRVRLVNNSDITITSASGSASVIGASVDGNYKTISTTGSITVAEGGNNPSPAEHDKSEVDVTMIQFDISPSAVEDARMTGIVITHQGDGEASNDILNNGVQLVRDNNNNGSFDNGTDDILGSVNYSGSTATFSISDTITASATEHWLVMYDFSGNATHNTTFQARLQSSGNVTATGVSTTNSMPVNGSFPIVGGSMTITDNATISLTGTDIGPGSINPGDSDVALLRIDLQADKNIGTISAIQIDNRSSHGTTSAADVDSVYIYLENGTSAGFQPGEDTKLGSNDITADGSGGSVNIALSPNLSVDNTGEILFVVYDIDAAATASNKIGVRIASESYVTTANGQTYLNSGDYPVVTNNDYSLPVELSSFEINSVPGMAVLTWSTASEIDNLGFAIERKSELEGSFSEIADYRDTPELQGMGNSAIGKDYTWMDEDVRIGHYSYRLIQYDRNGARHIITSGFEIEITELKPESFTLQQNYPNPFNPQTTISFVLPKSGLVSLAVYNAIGQQVIKLLDNEPRPAGDNRIIWKGQDKYGQTVASGVYIYIIQAGDHRAVRKMIFMK